MAVVWSTLLAISFASGLNIYATILALGLFDRFNLVVLPGQLDVVSSIPVMTAAAVMYAIEFIADKIPYVDNIWDVIHTAVRPIGAAVLAYSAVGDIGSELQMLAAIVGGGVALTSHTAKASTRAAANLSPEPFSNWVLSAIEDVIAVFVVWLWAAYPLIALAVVVVLLSIAVFIVIKFAHLIRRAWRRRAV